MIQEIITVIVVSVSVIIAVVGIVRRIRHRGDDSCDCGCGCGSSCPMKDQCTKPDKTRQSRRRQKSQKITCKETK